MPLSSRRRNRGARFSERINALLSHMFVAWETEVFNKPVFKWGLRHARYLKLWFGFGVGFGVSLMGVMFFMVPLQVSSLSLELSSKMTSNEFTKGSGQVLTLVIPGVNVAWSDLPYMMLATIIAVGFHELGHAIAAASEGVAIEHVAVFLACLVPGALVALNQESLQLLSPIRALRIYCAGIWHNLVCCAGCYLVLLLLQSVSSLPDAGKQNVVISRIDATSPLAGYLHPGDHIASVNGLLVQKAEDWFEFLYNRNMGELSQIKYTDFMNPTAKESRVSVKYIASQGYCVQSMNSEKHESVLSGYECSNGSLLFYRHFCMDTLPSSVNSSQSVHCLKAVDVVECPLCIIKQNTSQKCSCPESSACLLPILNHGEVFVGMSVIQLSAKHCNFMPVDPICKHALVFVGPVRSLAQSLQLTDHRPHTAGVLGVFWMFCRHIESLSMYTFSLSAAMALLNSAPVSYLDGESIFQAGLLLNKAWIPAKGHKKIMRTVLTVGTILMALLLTLSFMNFIT